MYMPKYPNLAAEISRRGVRKSVIASSIGISQRTLANKLNGLSPFTWDEAATIRKVFFPDVSLDLLFSTET